MGTDVVFIWQIPLEQSPEVRRSLMQSLSADELQRAKRFVFDIHRERFVVARGALRTIMGQYVGRPPTDIAFQYSQHGKPALTLEQNLNSVSFNLSHSSDLAICAVTLNRDVGIDVEARRQIVDADRMVARFFAPPEVSSYQALLPAEKPEGFLIRWTMKEAYIKAHGKGLAMPLDKFSVSASPDQDGVHRVCTADPYEDARWSIKRLSPLPGYIAAIAVEGNSWNAVYRTWPDDLATRVTAND